jgi:hypothetical protein
MLTVHVIGVGLVGPGLVNAAALAPGWVRSATVIPAPARLPATERRRAGPVVKLAIEVAGQACDAAGLDPATLPTVFTSSTGEPSNCHALCEALAQPERLVSPTRFTNSVHNAAAGYWHIATASRAPSTSLAAFDASFGAGLLEAAAQCVAGAQPVLLVACDVPYPEPLHAKRPLPDSFGVALVLAPQGAGPRLAIECSAGEAMRCDDPALEALRATIPAARALPLLQALAAPRVVQLDDLRITVGA